MFSGAVAVTGANGFVGGAILRSLLDQGTRAVGLVRPGRGLAGRAWPRREVATWTRQDLEEALSGAAHVVHAASVVHRPGASRAEYEAFNVEGTRALVEACRSLGVRRIVFLSTIKVYGEGPCGVIDESTPVDFSGGYSASKIAAEHILTESAEQGGPQVTVLRLCPVFGPGDKGNVRRVALAIARGRFLVPGDGSHRKSVVHVSTVAGAVLRALERDVSGTFVLADRHAPSMRELGNRIASALGRRSPFSVPVPIVLAMATAIETLAVLRGVEPSISRELIRKSLRSTVCSPARFEREFDFDCCVEMWKAIEAEVAWLRSEGLL
jgi:nucleoside-diphosphate-sugar epimerase